MSKIPMDNELAASNRKSAVIRQLEADKAALVAALEMMKCWGCENRIGWNGPTAPYPDWRTCPLCAAGRAALKRAKGEV